MNLVKKVLSKVVKYLRYIIIAFLLVFSRAFALGADSLHAHFGVYGGTGWNYHTSSFRTLPGEPNCCDNFTKADGLNMTLGGLLRYPLGDQLFLESRIGYNHLSGIFTRNESMKVVVDNQFIDGLIEHYILASIGTINYEQFAGFKIFDRLSVQLGASVGYLLLRKFHQKEEIVTPADVGVFSDTKQRVRNDISGTIKDVNPLQVSVIAGTGYDFWINNSRTLLGRAELFGEYYLTNILQDYKWRVFSVRAGVSVQFMGKEKLLPIRIDTVRRDSILIDTIRQEMASSKIFDKFHIGLPHYIETITDVSANRIVLLSVFHRVDTVFFAEKPSCSIVIYADKKNQNKQELRQITIHQQYTTQIFPILTKLFFDLNSSELPERYNNSHDIPLFSTSNVLPHPLELNHQILNIIGFRMRQSTESKLMIRGYADKVTEMGDCALALARAESAKDYLITNWAIASERVYCTSSESNCSPRDATLSPIEEGYSENRRIEFESDDQFLLSEIVRSRYLESTIDPPAFRTEISFSNPKDVRNWKLEYGNRKLIRRIAEGNEGEGSIGFSADAFNNEILSGTDSVSCVYSALLSNGDTITSRLNLAVAKDTSSTEKQIISLTLFLVSDAEVSAQDKKIIRDFAENLATGDSIVITGYTDRLGQFEDNLRLSVLRARNVAEYLRSVLSADVSVVSVDGAGSIKLPPQIKSYSTPEERFLARTVRIEVSRMLKTE